MNAGRQRWPPRVRAAPRDQLRDRDSARSPRSAAVIGVDQHGDPNRILSGAEYRVGQHYARERAVSCYRTQDLQQGLHRWDSIAECPNTERNQIIVWCA